MRGNASGCTLYDVDLLFRLEKAADTGIVHVFIEPHCDIPHARGQSVVHADGFPGDAINILFLPRVKAGQGGGALIAAQQSKITGNIGK